MEFLKSLVGFRSIVSDSPQVLQALIALLATALALQYTPRVINFIMMQSPSAILSRVLAQALSDYFVVNPDDVQTSLFQAAGVTLTSLALKPRQVRINEVTMATITGTVRSASFHWNWGRDSKRADGSSLIHDVQLVLEGLSFCVTLSHASTSEAADGTVPPPVTKNDDTAEAPAGFVQDQVRRILDALTLTLTDFQVTIQMDPNLNELQPQPQLCLVFGVQGVMIESLGRDQPSDSLVQELFLQGLFCHVQSQQADDVDKALTVSGDTAFGSSLPLLEPVSYAATCMRVNGMPLESLLQNGMQILGKSSDQGIIVHVGQQQLECLNHLGAYLMASKGATATLSLESEESMGTTPLELSASNPRMEDSGVSKLQASSVTLPLTAISLVLPNETKIAMTALKLEYQLDGARCIVTCQGGISIDGAPLLALSDASVWQADMIESQFRVYAVDDKVIRQAKDGFVAKLHVRQVDLDRIKEGVQQLLGIVADMSTQESGVLKSMTEKVVSEPVMDKQPQASSTSRTWSAHVDSLDMVVTGVDGVDSMECLLCRVKFASDDMTLSISSIKRLRAPHSIRLLQPLENLVLRYEGSLVDISIQDVVAILDEPESSQQPIDDAQAIRQATLEKQDDIPSLRDDQVDNGPFVLPFGLHALINSVVVYETDGKTVHTSIKALRLAAGPDLSKDGRYPIGAVRTLVLVEEFNHDMLSLNRCKLSAVVHPNNLNRIDQVDFNARAIAIAAGYSVFDWKRLFATGDEKREPRKAAKREKRGTPICLPFVHVSELKIKIAVKATLVSTQDATLHLAAFQGNETTTLNEMLIWYTQRVLSNAPGVVTNANVLGFNVSDTAASYGGSVMVTGALSALGSAAAPVAGVLGMVGFDAVKNTINAGKRGRGVEDDDKRQLGDFVRGIGQLAKEAAQGGAVARGKSEDEQADAIDWALGATSDVTKYADENKARLGGAGVGAVGFGYGFLLGGPVGAVAGALIASQATSNAINAVDRRLRGKNNEGSNVL